MKRRLRISLSIGLSTALSLMLVLTSHSMAQARGKAQVAGKMVICTGMGARVVYVDVEGAPTSAPHVCPDCALGVMQGLLNDQITLVGVASWRVATTEQQKQLRICSDAKIPQARGPPCQV